MVFVVASLFVRHQLYLALWGFSPQQESDSLQWGFVDQEWILGSIKFIFLHWAASAEKLIVDGLFSSSPNSPSCFPHHPLGSILMIFSQSVYLSFLLHSSNSTRARVWDSIFAPLLLGFLFYFLPLLLFAFSVSSGQDHLSFHTVGAKYHPSFLFSITSIEDEQSPQTNGNVQNCYTTELIYCTENLAWNVVTVFNI